MDKSRRISRSYKTLHIGTGVSVRGVTSWFSPPSKPTWLGIRLSGLLPKALGVRATGPLGRGGPWKVTMVYLQFPEILWNSMCHILPKMRRKTWHSTSRSLFKNVKILFGHQCSWRVEQMVLLWECILKSKDNIQKPFKQTESMPSISEMPAWPHQNEQHTHWSPQMFPAGHSWTCF